MDPGRGRRDARRPQEGPRGGPPGQGAGGGTPEVQSPWEPGCSRAGSPRVL